LGGAFAFVINGTTAKASASDAAALSPAVGLQLSVDAWVRTFAVEGGEVSAGAVSLSAQSRVSPPVCDCDSDPERRALIFLFRRLWNSSLGWESLFAGLQGCAQSLPNSVSLLSVDAAMVFVSEDALFEWILCHGSDSFVLLRHVRWDRLTGSLPPAFGRGLGRASRVRVGEVSDFVGMALGSVDHRRLRKFAPKTERASPAIRCHSSCSPCFSRNREIALSNNCQQLHYFLWVGLRE
jgi:hypothetical protein